MGTVGVSRSATAEGTLILQGFDAWQVAGGCSGALRQEFRELELLDDVTRLRYIQATCLRLSMETQEIML